MNEEQIADIWNLFKSDIDKKQIDIVAERYVDLLADYGTDDIMLKEILGIDKYLDAAINYYLDDDEDSFDEEEWDE